MEVCLFDDGPDGAEVETRHPLTEQTLGIWHGAVPGVEPGQRYGFRVDGPWEPHRGRVFNPAKLLLDPYARAVSGRVDHDGPVHGYRRTGRSGQELGARCDDDSAPYVPRSVVVRDDFDWGDDEQVRPRTSWIDTVVYELHVKGFTEAPPGGARAAARDLRGPQHRRGRALPQGPRSHRRRAAAGAPEQLRAARRPRPG